MKKFAFVLSVIFLVGCSVNREVVQVLKGDKGDKGADGASCSVVAEELGTRITCSNGSTSLILNGPAGSNGINGVDGQSCSVEREETRAVITCGDQVAYVNDGVDGTDGNDGSDGAVGPQGPAGPPGAPGQDGQGGATIQVLTISSHSCTIVDSLNSTKRNGNEVKVYKTTNCSGSHIVLNDGHAMLTSKGNLLFNNEDVDTLSLVTFN